MGGGAAISWLQSTIRRRTVMNRCYSIPERGDARKSLHDRCFLRPGARTEESMLSREHNGHATDPNHHADEAAAPGEVHEPNPAVNEAVTVAATVGVVAAGVALFEVALLPGMVIGVAAMLAPKYVPKMSAALAPAFKSTVRGAYKFGRKTREMVAEAKEQVHDIVAEVHAEGETVKTAAAEPPKA
jgi:hypothetical protein